MPATAERRSVAIEASECEGVKPRNGVVFHLEVARSANQSDWGSLKLRISSGETSYWLDFPGRVRDGRTSQSPGELEPELDIRLAKAALRIQRAAPWKPAVRFSLVLEGLSTDSLVMAEDVGEFFAFQSEETWIEERAAEV